MKIKTENFKIKIVTAAYSGKEIIYKNDLIIDELFSFVEANAAIAGEIRRQTNDNGFFRAPNSEYDIVKYGNEGRKRLYMGFSHIKAELVA